MNKTITIACLVALGCIVAAFTFISPHDGGADVVSPNGEDFSYDRYPPVEAYGARVGDLLRRQYISLAEAFRKQVGSSKRAEWVKRADAYNLRAQFYIATAPVPAGGYLVRADAIDAMNTWEPVRRDADYALLFCRIRGHIKAQLPNLPALDELDAFEFDALRCTTAAKFIGRRDAVAIAHVNTYFAALRKMDVDSGLSVSNSVRRNWDLANDREVWIYGKPYRPNPPNAFTSNE